jgi:hypothetical protein
MHGKNSKDEETSQQKGGFALLRTVFCLGSQEMGGLKPGAALALVKAAPVMRGCAVGQGVQGQHAGECGQCYRVADLAGHAAAAVALGRLVVCICRGRRAGLRWGLCMFKAIGMACRC